MQFGALDCEYWHRWVETPFLIVHVAPKRDNALVVTAATSPTAAGPVSTTMEARVEAWVRGTAFTGDCGVTTAQGGGAVGTGKNMGEDGGDANSKGGVFKPPAWKPIKLDAYAHPMPRHKLGMTQSRPPFPQSSESMHPYGLRPKHNKKGPFQLTPHSPMSRSLLRCDLNTEKSRIASTSYS
jgi:hypothetical protein